MTPNRCLPNIPLIKETTSTFCRLPCHSCPITAQITFQAYCLASCDWFLDPRFQNNLLYPRHFGQWPQKTAPPVIPPETPGTCCRFPSHSWPIGAWLTKQSDVIVPWIGSVFWGKLAYDPPSSVWKKCRPIRLFCGVAAKGVTLDGGSYANFPQNTEPIQRDYFGVIARNDGDIKDCSGSVGQGTNHNRLEM